MLSSANVRGRSNEHPLRESLIAEHRDVADTSLLVELDALLQFTRGHAERLDGLLLVTTTIVRRGF